MEYYNARDLGGNTRKEKPHALRKPSDGRADDRTTLTTSHANSPAKGTRPRPTNPSGRFTSPGQTVKVLRRDEQSYSDGSLHRVEEENRQTRDKCQRNLGKEEPNGPTATPKVSLREGQLEELAVPARTARRLEAPKSPDTVRVVEKFRPPLASRSRRTTPRRGPAAKSSANGRASGVGARSTQQETRS